MAQGRKPQNVKVENMKDTHLVFALDVLDALLAAKTPEALAEVQKVARNGAESVAKLNGRTIVCRNQIKTRLKNRLEGPKVRDDEELEKLL